MSINKTSISANSLPNAVAQKFNNTAAKPRLKHGLIYTKTLSSTAILAKLGHSKSAKDLGEQRQAYKDWLESSLALEYRLENPDAIKLSKPNGLSGQQSSVMRASAAVANAAEGFDVKGLLKDGKIRSEKNLEDILRSTRRQVMKLDTNASAEDRIHVAKTHMLECLMSELMPDLPEEKQGFLKFICMNLHKTTHCKNPDDVVIECIQNLLWKVEFDAILGLLNDPSLKALDALVSKKRHSASQ